MSVVNFKHWFLRYSARKNFDRKNISLGIVCQILKAYKYIYFFWLEHYNYQYMYIFWLSSS